VIVSPATTGAQETTIDGNRLLEVDVLRGLAALAVVVFHYSGHSQRYFDGFPFYFEAGKYGVQVFFVLSGFFIFLTVERCHSAKEFLVLRFSRLYPAYWTTLACLLAFELLKSDGRVWWGGFATNFTMFQAFIGFPDIDIVYWSLAVEMAFYLLMFMLLATRAIRFPLGVAWCWLVLCNLWPLAQTFDALQVPWIRTLAGLLVHGPFFLGGMMIYLIRKSNWRNLFRPVLVLATCVVTAANTAGMTVAVVAVVAFALMGLAALGKLKFLVAPFTVWLGSISYSLYLVHRNLGYAALFKLDAMGVDSRLAFMVVLVGALALASAVTYGIEQPVLKSLRASLRRTGSRGG